MYYASMGMSLVAADKSKLKPDDSIEFKFEKSPF